jgi:hypothetical protein
MELVPDLDLFTVSLLSLALFVVIELEVPSGR